MDFPTAPAKDVYLAICEAGGIARVQGDRKLKSVTGVAPNTRGVFVSSKRSAPPEAPHVRDVRGADAARRHINDLTEYLHANCLALVNYGRRRLDGLRISTAFVGSAVNEILSKRMIKKQPMRWNRWTPQPLLDTRIAVLINADFQTDNDNNPSGSQDDEPHDLARPESPSAILTCSVLSIIKCVLCCECDRSHFGPNFLDGRRRVVSVGKGIRLRGPFLRELPKCQIGRHDGEENPKSVRSSIPTACHA